jgi:hypothetical protein
VEGEERRVDGAGLLQLGGGGLIGLRMNRDCEAVRKRDVQGYISGKREIMLMNKPGSEIVGYGLKVARIPSRMKAAYNGSCLPIH